MSMAMDKQNYFSRKYRRGLKHTPYEKGQYEQRKQKKEISLVQTQTLFFDKR